jgi:hypothetical protein
MPSFNQDDKNKQGDGSWNAEHSYTGCPRDFSGSNSPILRPITDKEHVFICCDKIMFWTTEPWASIMTLRPISLG